MIQTFTQNDVIRYVYEETTSEENLLIQDALMHDAAMLEFYLDLVEVKLSLDNSYREPSAKTIDSILSYSRSKATHIA